MFPVCNLKQRNVSCLHWTGWFLVDMLIDMSAPDTEDAYIEAIDEAIKKAAILLDGSDLPDDIDDEEMTDILEDRHHCGTCQVRTVMEEIWPKVENYIDFIKGQSNE